MDVGRTAPAPGVPFEAAAGFSQRQGIFTPMPEESAYLVLRLAYTAWQARLPLPLFGHGHIIRMEGRSGRSLVQKGDFPERRDEESAEMCLGDGRNIRCNR